jgi:hypothetical protein
MLGRLFAMRSRQKRQRSSVEDQHAAIAPKHRSPGPRLFGSLVPSIGETTLAVSYCPTGQPRLHEADGNAAKRLEARVRVGGGQSENSSRYSPTPRSLSSRATAVAPWIAVSSSGVRPLQLTARTSAPCAISSSATARWFPCAAACSGVSP